jgi:hypothetical protein
LKLERSLCKGSKRPRVFLNGNDEFKLRKEVGSRKLNVPTIKTEERRWIIIIIYVGQIEQS